MNTISEVFNDQIMQSMVFGPLAGVALGALFAGLTNAPASQALTSVRVTKKVYIQNINIRRGSSEKNRADDSGPFVAALVGLMLFVVWGYASYQPQILLYMTGFLLTAFAFSCTTAIVSLGKGQFSSNDWFGYILPPLVVLMCCMYLLGLADSSFAPDLVAAAKSTNFINFYMHVLTDYGRRLLMAQVVGVGVLFSVIFLTSIAVIHYLSLMNQRSEGFLQEFWSYLAEKTMFCGGRRWLVACLFMLVFASVALDPQLLTSWMASK